MRELAREPMPGEIRLQWWRDVLGRRTGRARRRPIRSRRRCSRRSRASRCRLRPLLDLIEARSFDLYDDPMPTAERARRLRRIRRRRALIELAAQHPRGGHDPRCDPTLPSMPELPTRIVGAAACVARHAARRSSICRSICWSATARGPRMSRRASHARAARARWPSCAASAATSRRRRGVASCGCRPRRRRRFCRSRWSAGYLARMEQRRLRAVPHRRRDAAMAAPMDAVARGAALYPERCAASRSRPAASARPDRRIGRCIQPARHRRFGTSPASRASSIIACAISCSPMMTLLAPWRSQVAGFLVRMRARDDRELRIDRARLLDDLAAFEAVRNGDQQAARRRVVRRGREFGVGGVADDRFRCPACAAPRRCPRRSRMTSSGIALLSASPTTLPTRP